MRSQTYRFIFSIKMQCLPCIHDRFENDASSYERATDFSRVVSSFVKSLWLLSGLSNASKLKKSEETKPRSSRSRIPEAFSIFAASSKRISEPVYSDPVARTLNFIGKARRKSSVSNRPPVASRRRIVRKTILRTFFALARPLRPRNKAASHDKEYPGCKRLPLVIICSSLSLNIIVVCN